MHLASSTDLCGNVEPVDTDTGSCWVVPKCATRLVECQAKPVQPVFNSMQCSDTFQTAGVDCSNHQLPDLSCADNMPSVLEVTHADCWIHCNHICCCCPCMLDW